MRYLFLILLCSFTVQASIIDRIWSFVERSLNLGSASQSMELPHIPQPNNNPLDTSVYLKKIDSLYPANKVLLKWSADQKRKTNIGYVQELFQMVQVRHAKISEIAKWYNVLDQGSSREGLYRAIVLGDIYRKLENLGLPNSLEAVNFTNDYIQKYLKQTTQKDLLKKTDAYQLKKIVVDTTLKTVEALSSKPNDLFTWYAILSTDLASQFPKIWKYPLRGNKDEQTHYQWAKKTPYQHIVSEVILKLHRVYNQMCNINLR